MTVNRRRTRDLASALVAEAIQHPVYTVEQLGPNREMLPNGNLLCKNVPIARTGWLIYGPGEVPVAPAANGMSYVERTSDALFNPITMGSFLGSAVVNDHPPEDVSPENWSRYSGGFTLNVRRGTGDDADVLLADLMVTRKDLIADILAGKVEVSAGYDAGYEDLGGGAGKQHHIVGNHIALVKTGRCGPRCAIGDQAYQVNPETQPEDISTMATAATTARPTRRRNTIDSSALDALRVRAQEAVEDLRLAEDEAGEDDSVHVHIHNGGAAGDPRQRTGDEDRLGALETGLEELRAMITDGFAALAKPTITTTAATGDAAAVDDDDKKTYDAEDDSDEAKAWRAKMKAKKTGDAAYEEGSSKALATSYAALVASAEVLVPGFKVPTFDAAYARAKTVDRMCSARRLCLSQLHATADGAALLKGLSGGGAPDIVSMDCPAAKALFDSAATARSVLNNLAAQAGGKRTGDAAAATDPAAAGAPKTPTIAEMNEANRKFWEGK